MPIYQYEAIDASGQHVKAEINVANSIEAAHCIRALGYFPTRITEKGVRRLIPGAHQPARSQKKRTSAARFHFGRVGSKQLCEFARQFSTLQDAGLPILRSLRILEQQEKPGLFKTVIRQVAEDIEAGSTLSEAMGKHPRAFDRLFVNMIQAGEAGGVLEEILQRLADFMERSQQLKKKVIGAMIYPTTVILFAFSILVLILWMVVPRFQDIFKDFNIELPRVTLALLAVSHWLIHDFGWAFVLGVPLGFILSTRILRQFAGGRYVLDWVRMRLPILGVIARKSAVARFSRTLGTLLSAGVPILEAVSITRQTAGNQVYARALGQVHAAIREGDTFANPLRVTGVCDAIVVNMIDVGEETGEVDKMLLKIADKYDNDVETLVNSLVSLLEPLMVIILGCMVGFIVIALFMPLIRIISMMTG